MFPSFNKDKTMEFVRLGNSGLKVSRICLGMMSYGDKNWRDWVLPFEDCKNYVKAAYELGINFFDTADVYSLGVSEQFLGRSLQGLIIPRDQVVIATKVRLETGPGPNDYGLSRKHIFQSIEKSLKNLQTDYVDLYQIHRWDSETPIEETMEALNDLVRSGKVRYIGASSMRAWQFAKAQAIAEKNGWAKFVSMQNHYNLLYREEEREMIPLCADQGVGLIPWSPLARGILAGNQSGKEDESKHTLRSKSDPFTPKLYNLDETDFKIAGKVRELAQKKGVSAATLAISWLLHKGVTAPIIGATKIHHLQNAVDAVKVSLSAEEIQELESAYQPRAMENYEMHATTATRK